MLKELAKKDPRAIYRDSVESKVINKKLYGEKYYFIPERFRESLLDEFYKTYEAEKKKLDMKGSTDNRTSADSSTQKIKSKKMTKEERQEKNNEAQRKKKEADASWFEQMGIQQPMDNN